MMQLLRLGGTALRPTHNLRPVLLPAFRFDVQEITLWSEAHFGVAASDRYVALIGQALHDVQQDPDRLGARSRPELAPGAFVYHLSFSGSRVTGPRVKAPRHFLLYRCRSEVIEFARLLHDSQDFVAHLPADWQV